MAFHKAAKNSCLLCRTAIVPYRQHSSQQHPANRILEGWKSSYLVFLRCVFFHIPRTLAPAASKSFSLSSNAKPFFFGQSRQAEDVGDELKAHLTLWCCFSQTGIRSALNHNKKRLISRSQN